MNIKKTMIIIVIVFTASGVGTLVLNMYNTNPYSYEQISVEKIGDKTYQLTAPKEIIIQLDKEYTPGWVPCGLASVDWGDSDPSSNENKDTCPQSTHTYTSAGTYIIHLYEYRVAAGDGFDVVSEKSKEIIVE